ncbi:hypothetical protein Ocin01_16752 [Orchesella cincta]|uniref:Uncharacterized protein n=1 Tax=Orchesella cincta TaxID=48709 RepID=A0A1D2MAC6_ORCCI|nr:hypothetical protein Ocin01_16752 [Orchesella cincta]
MFIAANGATFKHPNFAVWFDPYVSTATRLHSYNVSGLIPIVSKIASRFSRIMMPYFSIYNDLNTYTPAFIPAAVATFNKLHRKPQQKPLELIMPFSQTEPGDGSVHTDFDMVQELGNKANSIFPGTVKRFIFRYQTLSSNVFSNVKQYLAYINRAVDRSKYSLGADILLSDCGGSSKALPAYLSPFLMYFSEVLFTYWPENQKSLSGPVATAQHFSKMFEQCVQKMEREWGSVAVGFKTAWHGTASENYSENSLHLVQYWELMNEIAINLNKTAVMVEAFNTNHEGRSSEFRRQGWWKLVENANYNDSSQYVFEEKMTAIQHLLPGGKTEIDNEFNSTVQHNLNSDNISTTSETSVSTSRQISLFRFTFTTEQETTTLISAAEMTTVTRQSETTSFAKETTPTTIETIISETTSPFQLRSKTYLTMNSSQAVSDKLELDSSQHFNLQLESPQNTHREASDTSEVSTAPNLIISAIVATAMILLILTMWWVVVYAFKSLHRRNSSCAHEQIVFRS